MIWLMVEMKVWTVTETNVLLGMPCDPSACHWKTEGHDQGCLQGAGRNRSACNWKTEGRDQCCLHVPPLAPELLEESSVAMLPPTRSTGPTGTAPQGPYGRRRRNRALSGTSDHSWPVRSHAMYGAGGRWLRGSLA